VIEFPGSSEMVMKAVLESVNVGLTINYKSIYDEIRVLSA